MLDAMKAASPNGPWIILRIVLYALAIGGAVLAARTGKMPQFLPWAAIGAAVAGIATSVMVGNLLDMPVVSNALSVADVVILGLVMIFAGDPRSPAVYGVYGLIALSSVGASLTVGLACALVGALMYALTIAMSLDTTKDVLNQIVPLAPNLGLFFVFGSTGLLVKKIVAETAPVQVVETLDIEIEKAQREARKQFLEKEEKERALYDKQRKLWALVSISHTMSSTRKPEDLLTMVVRKAKEEINTGVAFVMLLEKDQLVLFRSEGISEMTRRMIPDQQIFRDVVTRGQSQRLSEKDADPRLLVFKSNREPFRNILVVPLQAQDPTPFGVLGVANILVGDHFEAEHEEFLKILATSASISLKNINLYEELERSYYEIIHALAQAIEAKDPYTHGHIGRVRNYAIDLARALKLPEKEVEIIAKGAILHDVGKISTPNEILNKPGALTPAERRKMDEHVTSSIHILKDIKSLPPEVFEMVLYHHERFDGKGYPYGLKGDEIPLGAQIISVVDAFDAMTTDRPYRKGFTKEKALELLASGSGSQFNPKVLQAFFSLFDVPPPGGNGPAANTLQLKR
jgi:putative nucleotidyltransferase with HDIG domain